MFDSAYGQIQQIAKTSKALVVMEPSLPSLTGVTRAGFFWMASVMSRCQLHSLTWALKAKRSQIIYHIYNKYNNRAVGGTTISPRLCFYSCSLSEHLSSPFKMLRNSLICWIALNQAKIEAWIVICIFAMLQLWTLLLPWLVTGNELPVVKLGGSFKQYFVYFAVPFFSALAGGGWYRIFGILFHV